MSGKIFISYRRDDASAWARLLYDRLFQHFAQNEIFMDVDTIEPGVDFVEAIEESVGSCELCCLEVELPAANQCMKLVFEPVFNLSIPRRGSMRLRPEIFDRIGSAEFEWNQVINLVSPGPCDMMPYSR